MSASPRDLILQGSWHHALFTTYSLSLAFFESQLWRGVLKKKGCREAWVIADIDGYSESLGERQSRFVGHEYRLVPVALPRGVFHPKCIFLSGPEGAVLMIGSGNLTFGGHGRNIEVLEVFRSAEHPAIFGEFADFLAALRDRADFLNPEPGWLTHFEALARRAVGKSASASSSLPRLLHSTSRSILDQLADFAHPLGALSEARILSPYFDPQAEAVVALAQRLKVPHILIGLPPRQDEKSAFPFARPPAGGRIDAATVAVESPQRKLHAKWIELEFAAPYRLTLTGSVNATRQALCSSNNIEVGILRSTPEPGPSPLHWKTVASPAETSRPDFEKPGLGSRALLHARLAEDGRLLGRVIGAPEKPVSWGASLDLPDGESLAFEVSLASDGSFAHRMPSGTRFEGSPGLQLHLRHGQIHARCWVQNDWLIELAHLGAHHAAPLIALFQGDSDDEDELAFLTFLHDGIAQLAPAMAAHHSSRAASGTVGTKKTQPEHVLPVSALKPSTDAGDSAEDEMRAFGSSARQQRLAEVLDRLLREFEERPAKALVSRSTLPKEDDLSDDEVVAETEESKIPRRESKAHHASLFRLRTTVRDYLQKEGAASAKRAACLLWLQVELRAHLRDSPSDLQPALEFLREWFLQTTRHCRWQAIDDNLDERVWLIVCVLGLRASQFDCVGLHESLEDYLPATPSELLSAPPRVPPAFAGLAPSGSDLLAGVAAIRASRTRRQEINELRRCAAASPPDAPPTDLSICLHGDGKEAQRRLLAKRRVEFRELLPGRRACPGCHMTLPSASQETLRRQRIIACTNCDRFVIDMTPRS
jgi:hypothetical protein